MAQGGTPGEVERVRKIIHQTTKRGDYSSIRFIIAFLILWNSPAFSQEQRCQDLIDDGDRATFCGCSEPLDNADASLPTQGTHDPSDSPDSIECANHTANPNPLGLGEGGTQVYSGCCGESLEIVNGNTGAMVSASNVDAPLPGIRNVLEIKHGPGAGGANQLDYEFTNATWCMRRYIHWNDAEWPNTFLANGNQDIKTGRWDDGHNNMQTGLQSVMNPEGWCVHPESGQSGSIFLPTTPNISGCNWLSLANRSSSEVSFLDCQQSWCRQELCVDHNSRGGADAKKLVYRARVVRIDTGETASYPSAITANSNSTVWTGTKSFLTQFATPDWIDQPFPRGARTYYSHLMVAFKNPADESFWIGPALEIEGGTTPPPVPPPAAPQPPFLLGD